MGKEQQPDRLKERIISSFRDLLARNTDLAKGVEEAFKNGAFDAAEIAAALQLSEGISRTVREVVESGKEHVIFSRDQGSIDQSTNQPLLQPQSTVHPEKQPVVLLPKEKEGFIEPQTFGDLLFLRLDKALPDGQEFTRAELDGFTRSIKGSVEILNSQTGDRFSREESLKILQRILTTPHKNLDRKEEYDEKQLLKSFPLIKFSNSDEWSLAVGHDWSETPKVDFTTAMQIRGLGMLGKLRIPAKTSE